MQLSILQDVLHRALTTVRPAVASRSSLPVLSNVLLQAQKTDDGGWHLMVAANNLEQSIATYAPARVEAEGAITVPYRLLSELVNSFPPERIDITLDEAAQCIDLACGSYETTIKGIDAKEFPVPPTGRPDEAIEIPLPEDFPARAERVVFSAATEESRPVFTGVLMRVCIDRVEMVAADGYRLSVDERPWDCPPEMETMLAEGPLDYIIPAKSLASVAKIVADSEAEASMFVEPNGRRAVFMVADTVVASALIEGEFPDYSRIIPERHNTAAVIDRAQLQQAVRLSHLFAREGADIVTLTITPSANGGPGSVTLFAQSQESGDNEAELAAAVEGDPVEIAFNAKYLIDMLAVGGLNVRLETRSPSAPGRLTVAGVDGWQHVLMPMHL